MHLLSVIWSNCRIKKKIAFLRSCDHSLRYLEHTRVDRAWLLQNLSSKVGRNHFLVGKIVAFSFWKPKEKFRSRNKHRSHSIGEKSSIATTMSPFHWKIFASQELRSSNIIRLNSLLLKRNMKKKDFPKLYEFYFYWTQCLPKFLSLQLRACFLPICFIVIGVIFETVLIW